LKVSADPGTNRHILLHEWIWKVRVLSWVDF